MTGKEDSTYLQRAEGLFELEARRRDTHTRRGSMKQGGCSRLLFPRRDSPQLEAVMVNISGGLAAGDQLLGRLTCHEEADLLMSAQAHERVYRARSNDAPACVETTCTLAPHARLEWLPHGTILFDGARFNRHMSVDMASSSRFLFYESRIYGRYASSERLQSLSLRDRLSIRRDGRPLVEECTALEGALIQSLLQHPAMGHNARLDATLIMVAPEVTRFLPKIRPLLAELGEGTSFAASCWNDTLIIRGLAQSNWDVEQLMSRLLPILREERPMPTGWRL
ncbi:urease accessory protein UreD [Saccharibacter floricola]|uniref:Urease accessory protein UreD n=1 Tax=Saccharibacter floricola DSM 15669 TaxID=1123227 RepID=A0ABQ0NYE4_9PROT|nr:urease accessory protein UreD [Saccharibacter floricola]GBQ06298.1 urease accessory protein UreH [Saccharibacter floricola DSM 15669]